MSSKITFWVAIGFYLFTYISWSVLNLLTHLAPSAVLDCVQQCGGTVCGISAIGGWSLLPIGLAQWKCLWRLSEQFFALTGINFCIALMLSCLPPTAVERFESTASWVDDLLWQMSVLFFFQGVLQGIVLGVAHWLTKKTGQAPQRPFWLRLVMDVMAMFVWVGLLCWSAYWMDQHFCC